jgi:hypothetical protein
LVGGCARHEFSDILSTYSSCSSSIVKCVKPSAFPIGFRKGTSGGCGLENLLCEGSPEEKANMPGT